MLAARDRQLSTARGLSFLVVASAGVYGLLSPSSLVWAAVGATTACFIVFVVLHAKLSTRQFELERRISLRRQGLERVRGTHQLGQAQATRRGDHLRAEEHPYSGDLDLFGPGSLFELLNTTQSPGGAEQLADWLRAPAPPAVVEQRQDAARELAARHQWREQLALAGLRAAGRDLRHQPLLAWSVQSTPKSNLLRAAALVGALLALCTAVLLPVGPIVGGVWAKAWLFTVVPQIILAVATRGITEPLLAPVCSNRSPPAAFRELLRLVETMDVESPALTAARTPLLGGSEECPSRLLGRLDSLLGVASVRHNSLVHLLANTFLSWDAWCGWLVHRWRALHGPRVAGWLRTLAEVEALAALGTFAYEHPQYVWPKLITGAVHLRARALGHPLIAEQRRVTNDVALEADCHPAVLITGSNMSGKSTMLRSIGVAAVLAQAGAPVCARELSLSPLRVFTSMRVGDALDRGVSRFYAEVLKLERIVAALDHGPPPLLFLLDEVLHGTNSRERNIGAKTVVRHLIANGALGAVSSHDLGLVELEQLTGGAVRNVHFEDHLEDGQMHFDFCMKPGPVCTSNALRLMRSVGLDLPGLIEPLAEQDADGVSRQRP